MRLRLHGKSCATKAQDYSFIRSTFVFPHKTKTMKAIFFSCAVVLTLFAASCGTKETKVAYQCPMKCEGEKVYDSAGQCPACGMDMKEVKEAK